MKKKQKKYTILIIVLAIIIVGVIAIFFTMSNFNLSSKTYQNKVFVMKDSDMFFVEAFEMINYNEMDKLKATRVIYFDENYVYSFVPSNSQAEDYTKIEEYKSEYTLTGDQLNFILNDFAYTGQITKDGELELEIIGANVNKDLIGEKTKYVAKDEYEYENLKTKYLENKVNAWNELKGKLVKEIGNILGEEKYEKEEQNNRYGFQYNSKDLSHPIIVLEKNQEYKDLVVKNIRKITDNMYTITLGEDENGDKIFNLVIDGKYSKITTEYLRIKVRTTNPVENAVGVYTKSLQIEFDMNNTSQQILESNNSNNIENSSSSNNVEKTTNSNNSNFNNNSKDDTDMEKTDLERELQELKDSKEEYIKGTNENIAYREEIMNSIKEELPNLEGEAKTHNLEWLSDLQSIQEDTIKEQKEQISWYDKEIAEIQAKIDELK